MMVQIWSLGFRVQILGLRFQMLGIRVQILGLRFQMLGIRVQILGFKKPWTLGLGWWMERPTVGPTLGYTWLEQHPAKDFRIERSQRGGGGRWERRQTCHSHLVRFLAATGNLQAPLLFLVQRVDRKASTIERHPNFTCPNCQFTRHMDRLGGPTHPLKVVQSKDVETQIHVPPIPFSSYRRLSQETGMPGLRFNHV